jgi:hypothetical protein
MDWRRLRLACAGAIALCTYAPLAAGQEPEVPTLARVELVLPACAPGPFDGDAFVRLLTIELRAEGVTRVDVVAAGTTGAKDPALARVTLAASPCSESATQVDVTVDDAATNKTVLRTMALGDVAAGARPRALALAVAELVRASWAELALPNAPPPPPLVPARVQRIARLHAAPAPTPPEPSAGRPPPLALGAALAARFFPSYATATLGPRVALSAALGASPLRVRIDANALFGTAYDPLGSLPLGLVSGGGALLLGHRSGPLDVEIGPHLEVGYGWVTGHASTPGVATTSGGSVIVDLSAALDLRFELGAGFWATLDIDVGSVLESLDALADGRRAAGFDGPVAGVALGIARGF